MKKIALLISGEVRTFILKEQYFFFERLLHYLHTMFEDVHVYLVLKIPDVNTNELIKSMQGIENFKNIVELLKPTYSYIFHDFNYKNNFNIFNSQLKLLDMCIEKAIEYEKKHNISYDLFFRIRPDSCFLIQELNMQDKNENYIYTSNKYDAIGSDQSFIFNSYILNNWWMTEIKNIMLSPCGGYPESIIFNKYIPLTRQCYQCWLIRTHNICLNWCSNKLNKLESEYEWKYIDNYQQLLLKIPHEEYIKEIQKIVNIEDNVDLGDKFGTLDSLN